MTLEEWRQKAAADRPAPSAALLARLRPLITSALPRTQAAPALTGAASTAPSATAEPQETPEGTPK